MPEQVRQGGVTRGGSAGDVANEHGSIAAAALEASPDPIIVMDNRGIVRLASESVERVLGWTPAELVGRSAAVLIPEPDRPRHARALERIRRSRAPRAVSRARELVALRRDGSTVRVALAVSAFRDGAMFCGILQDISERKRSEDEQEHERHALEDLVRERTSELERSHQTLRMTDRLAAIGTLAAGLGHDMNNVLLPVRAHLNAILAGDASPAAREHGAAIRRSLAYLQQLADGLHFLALDPERESQGEATDLARWWEQTGTLLSKSIPGHIELMATIPPGLPRVRVVAHQLTQAVLNLLVNAGEAIPSEHAEPGRVRVWAEPAPDGAAVRLSVSDNGRGMSEDVRRRASEMFFTTKSRGMGTGLGLALVHRVVDRAGGTFELLSEPGKGTTVVLSLPAAPARAGVRDPGRHAVAVLSVNQPRGLAVVTQLLRAAGAQVSDEGALGHADLWILEPGGPSLEEVEIWMAAGEHRVPILLGSPAESERAAWTDLGAVIIADSSDLDSVRASLGQALADF